MYVFLCTYYVVLYCFRPFSVFFCSFHAVWCIFAEQRAGQTESTLYTLLERRGDVAYYLDRSEGETGSMDWEEWLELQKLMN